VLSCIPLSKDDFQYFLGSSNGTFVNNKPIEPTKYVELLERDVIKFGFSQREYVLLHENSKEDIDMDDDDVKPTIKSEDSPNGRKIKCEPED
jgi:pSer/pThr/pTyr-binding forkhead associated (FHA) protein